MLLTLFTVVTTSASPPLNERYDCAICHTLASFPDLDCSALPGGCSLSCGKCAATEAAAAALPTPTASTKAARTAAAAAPKTSPKTVQLRVSKGFGTKPYNTLRVSAITAVDDVSPINVSYSAPFRYKWTQNALHSSVMHVTPGVKVPYLDANTSLWLPAQGAGVSGVVIADPCVHAKGGIVGAIDCTFGKRWQTDIRTPALLNAFMRHDDTDFWGVLGDNWYDQSGKISARIYDTIEPATLAKIMLTVPGNHDYWVLSRPGLGTALDQYGNGHMQFYAQDTLAAADQLPGATAPPYDFAVDPSKGHAILGGSLPRINNSFYYHQIGNVGFVGFSGAYTYDELAPLFREACAWLPSQPGLSVGVIVGHWDKVNLGASDGSDVPGLYDRVKAFPGCAEMDGRRALKFLMGHTHCNVPHPHGHNETGFMVAGQGMEGCGNYGFPVLDTTEGRVRVYHFEVVSRDGVDTYDDVLACVSAKGWRQCKEHAELWLDQPLP